MAVQESPTSIRVTWTPPTSLPTGYRILYQNSDSTNSVDIGDGLIDNHLLTDLQNGEFYTISIVATSQHLPSESVDVEIGLCE